MRAEVRLIARGACTWCGHRRHAGSCDGCPCREHDRPEPVSRAHPGGPSIWQQVGVESSEASRLGVAARGGK